TYERTVAFLDDNPGLQTWDDFADFLRARGKEEVPEEVLEYYRPHYERHQAYLRDCEAVRHWAETAFRTLQGKLGTSTASDPRAFRKLFASLAVQESCSTLLFAALDDNLTLARVRAYLRTPEEARDMLARLR